VRPDPTVNPVECQIERFRDAAGRLECDLSLDRLHEAIRSLVPPRRRGRMRGSDSPADR
jgi:hypothetical protein